MGLTITSFPVMGGLTTINDVYVNVRDIKYTKEQQEEETIFKLEFISYYSKDDISINAQLLGTTYTQFYDGNVWTKAYEILKQDLTDKGLTYQDS
jgi:hypothetical protein